MEFTNHERGKATSKRKRDEDDEFNSSDDEVLSAELEFTERKFKKK